MRQITVILMSVLVCSLALAACGGSGSSSSTASNAPTVTNARLGATQLKLLRCDAPQVAGSSVTFGAITAIDTPCATAQAGILSVFKRGSIGASWTCKKTVAGRDTSVQCTHNSDNGQTFSGSWYRP